MIAFSEFVYGCLKLGREEQESLLEDLQVLECSSPDLVRFFSDGDNLREFSLDPRDPKNEELSRAWADLPTAESREFEHTLAEHRRSSAEGGRGGEADPLERWAFADERKDLSRGLEADTEGEEKLARVLVHFFQDNLHPADREVSLLRAAAESGKYADILRPPARAWVWRGMRGHRVNDRHEAVEGDECVFTPKRALSSWSLSRETAEAFLEGEDGEADGVLFRARVSGQEPGTYFFTGPGGLYKLRGAEVYNNEREVVGFGPVKCEVVEVRRREPD